MPVELQTARSADSPIMLDFLRQAEVGNDTAEKHAASFALASLKAGQTVILTREINTYAILHVLVNGTVILDKYATA